MHSGVVYCYKDGLMQYVITRPEELFDWFDTIEEHVVDELYDREKHE